MVMIITFLVVLALGVAFSIPFLGKHFLDSMALLTDYSDPRTIAGLKYSRLSTSLGYSFYLQSCL